MTYIDSGGISNYQSGGGGGSSGGLPSFFSGFAEGGFSDEPMLAKVSEGGHREIHLTQANIREFGLGNGGLTAQDIANALTAVLDGVGVYLDKDELVGSLSARQMMVARTQHGLSFK